MNRRARNRAHVPVICIGNFVAGGAGKTPTAIALARLLMAQGKTVGFLLRGYGGSLKRPTRVTEKHFAQDVGDEAILYASLGPTVVSTNRSAGAALLGEQAVDIILMDDGFQSPSLYKNGSLVVVDSQTGWGNGQCIPGGPLRAPLKWQLPKANAIVVLGSGPFLEPVTALAEQYGVALFRGAIVPDDQTAQASGSKCVAFSGIGRPGKFFKTLEENGYEISEQMSFPDHHMFSEQDAAKILARVHSLGAVPMTTEKDHVRLASAPSNTYRAELYQVAKVLKIRIAFSDELRVVEFLKERSLA